MVTAGTTGGNPKPETPDVKRPAPDGAAAPPARNGGTLIKNWIDHCATRPPDQIVGQVSRAVGKLLGEGIAYEHVEAGVAAWQENGTCAPTVIPSFVNQVMQGSTSRQRSRGQQYAPGSGPRLATGTSTKIDI